MNQSLTVSETKEFLLSIIGNSPMGIVVIDMNGYISVINKPAQILLNLNNDLNYKNKKTFTQVGIDQGTGKPSEKAPGTKK